MSNFLKNALKALFTKSSTIASTDKIPFNDSEGNVKGQVSISDLQQVLGVGGIDTSNKCSVYVNLRQDLIDAGYWYLVFGVSGYIGQVSTAIEICNKCGTGSYYRRYNYNGQWFNWNAF